MLNLLEYLDNYSLSLSRMSIYIRKANGQGY